MPPRREFRDCPCGRKIAKQNTHTHAGACELARNAGWETPPERVTQCRCGCKTRIVSYSSKPKHFVDGQHYDTWRRKQPEEAGRARQRTERWRKSHEPRRTLTEAQTQHEREAMEPLQQNEEEIRALYEHSNATFFTRHGVWDAERIRLYYLSFRKGMPEASPA